MSAYSEWQAGALTEAQALHVLASDLAETEDTLAPLLAERERLRNEIGTVLAHAGGKAQIPGFGRVRLTAPGVSVGYDADRIEYTIGLLAGQYPDIAYQLRQCRVERPRAGSLRIEREK